MDHLTNLYKHKCEQLQEQVNHLTRQLNEGIGINVLLALGKKAATIASEIAAQFAKLSSKEWEAAYHNLDANGQRIFRLMYGRIENTVQIGLYKGSVREFRIFRTGDGIPRINYWDEASGTWIPCENGVKIPNIGTNGNQGVVYQSNYSGAVRAQIHDSPDLPSMFAPPLVNQLPTRPNNGNIGGGGVGQQAGGPGY